MHGGDHGRESEALFVSKVRGSDIHSSAEGTNGVISFARTSCFGRSARLNVVDLFAELNRGAALKKEDSPA